MANVETVSVRNDLAELPVVYATLEAFCAGGGLPETVRRSLLLIIEELFSNTVSYGYANGQADRISVTASLGSDHVELTMEDKAAPFDGSVAPDGPDTQETVDLKAIGGLGLFLVHQLAEEVCYERIEDINRITVLVSRAAADTAD
ncbi:MAG: ATP-binding protein [Sulfitobacter sp.]|uniref:ATP-binding protein n=1 Tax=unclassified Roseibium TaxID=2629323 RepID=UPI003172A456